MELTGGECLCHRDVLEIIRSVADLPRVDILAILTNGWRVTKDLIDEIKPLRGKITFSVSLDSSYPEFHDDFRGREGSWQHAADAIALIAAAGFLCRVSMVYTPGNFFDIEDTLLFAKSLGAQCFTFSPVLTNGRGSIYKKELDAFTKNQGKLQIAQYLTGLHQKYKGFIFLVDERILDRVKEGRENCGLGHRTWAISPGGDVRPCV